ncbi:hypothetical protein WQ54_29615 [Bacillus sp. SA1-12]|uniref:hypothetical protein n=1 Tax=Bacillus sp. SA1-12 TaxID=1455638 RepID=UPI0006270452|nr:hypothetical protein [Bacillus sp. SA1-12]KKI88677.1 hypothetical protein WQ54_29615 [Bacillus sp. SA1-12]
MLKVMNQKEIIVKEEHQTNKFLQFIDGPGYEKLLQLMIKGLFSGILFFCIPYFLYLLLTLFN